MPFIVTTKRAEGPGDPHHWCGFGPDHHGECPPLDESGRVVVSHRAVATLPEAREACIQALPEEMKPLVAIDLAKQIRAVGEAGGTVRLHDGTTVSVEPCPGDQEMRSDLRKWGSSLDTVLAGTLVVADAWVEAYNSKQEG